MRESQEHANIARDLRGSIVVRSERDHGDAVGVSLAGRAMEVMESARVEHLKRMVIDHYPGVSFCASGGMPLPYPRQSCVAARRKNHSLAASVAAAYARTIKTDAPSSGDGKGVRSNRAATGPR